MRRKRGGWNPDGTHVARLEHAKRFRTWHVVHDEVAPPQSCWRSSSHCCTVIQLACPQGLIHPQG